MATSHSATRLHLTRCLLGACFALVAACAGESPTESGPGPKPSPAPLAKGVLALTVSGLDAGQPADIIVTGPAGFSRAVTTSSAVNELAGGRYTITARAVSANGRTYVPLTATQDVDIPSDGPPVPATVVYRLEAGVVIVTVGGLPGGVPADITLTPPAGTTISIAATRQLDDALPGRWRLAASAVASGGHTYRATPQTYDLTLAPNDTLRMPVDYALSTGAIAVAVTGLPTGTNGAVSVTGPGGYNLPVTGTVTLTDLVPGEYTVAATPVTAGVATFAPTPATRKITVTASLVAEPAAVTYEQQFGRLEISASGLSASITPTFTLTGNGVVREVSGTGVIDSLLPGTYTVTASTLVLGANTYTPTPTSQSVVISSAATTSASIAYTSGPTPGSLGIEISGLSAGTPGDVMVTGPGAFAQAITASTTLTGLVPGLYTIVARNVHTALGTYGATPDTREVNVTAGGAPVSTVVYAALPAVVQINVSGVPVGTPAVIIVTPPSAAPFSVTATTTINPAATGRWRLSAAAFTSSGVTFTPSTTSFDQTVLAGDTLRFQVAYTSSAPVVGGLTVTMTGLPIGVNGNVSISGPGGFSQTVITSSTLQNLSPGSYTLNANTVSNGGNTYTPAPSSANVSVTAGATASASFAYASGGGGGQNLSIENVYVTQAAQNWNGTAEIVTGRDALVRVFVKASAVNSLQPDVRVRVYEGATLIQTATISAPAGAVPINIAEGNLGLSWNLRIAAGNVRAGLRVLADVDPLNVIGEVNRNDNTWPLDGNPATISTATVPDLTVKFVPVTLNGMTGNVTNGNKDQFLALTRLAMPVQVVTSTVRAPFTSNAAPLESSNGNGAWATVLSEINALRIADGAASNMHYFGVVKAGYSSGVAGIAYVPGRAAVGWDALPSGDRVAAHELGHNFSRSHTPCGVGGDAQYPYAGGVTGVYGWNATTNALVPPTWTDVMGYCSNQWISDWTWSKVIEYRAISGYEATTAVVGDGLLIWGRVVDGRVVLEPAFRVRARPTPRANKSTHRVLLSDENGTTLTEVPIEAQLVDHSIDRNERQFAVVVPWSAQLERSVSRIAVLDPRTPFPAAVRISPKRAAGAGNASNAAVLPDPAESVQSAGVGRSRVSWDATRYPMALVRDASSGEILAFLRKPGDGYAAQNTAVELVFSDGVRSSIRVVAPKP